MKLDKQIDKLYALREERIALEKQEEALRSDVFAALRAQKLEQSAGAFGQVKIHRSEVPQLTDEDSFFAWGRLKANRDVMRVAVATAEWRKRLSAGDEVPGVESFVREDMVVSGLKK